MLQAACDWQVPRVGIASTIGVYGGTTVQGPLREDGALARHLAFLQLELADPEFHQHVLEHARVAREQTHQLLNAAIEHGKLRR